MQELMQKEIEEDNSNYELLKDNEVAQRRMTNYGMNHSFLWRLSTLERFEKEFNITNDGRIKDGKSREKVLIKIMDILDQHPELKEQVRDYPYYRNMKVKY